MACMTIRLVIVALPLFVTWNSMPMARSSLPQLSTLTMETLPTVYS